MNVKTSNLDASVSQANKLPIPIGFVLLSVVNILLSLSSVAVDAVIVSLAISLSFIDKIEDFNYDFISIGIWSGIIYGITGIIGIFASYTRTKPIIITSLVFAIFSFLSALGASILAGFRIAFYDGRTLIIPLSGISLNIYYEILTYLECALTIISSISALINLCLFILLCISLSRKNLNQIADTTVRIPAAKVVVSAPPPRQFHRNISVSPSSQIPVSMPVQQNAYKNVSFTTPNSAPAFSQLPIQQLSYQNYSFPSSPRVPIPPPLPQQSYESDSFQPNFHPNGYLNQQERSFHEVQPKLPNFTRVRIAQ